MTKTRIGLVLKDVVKSPKAVTEEDTELLGRMKTFSGFSKKLEGLIKDLKGQEKSLRSYRASQTKVADTVKDLVADTPLHSSVVASDYSFVGTHTGDRIAPMVHFASDILQPVEQWHAVIESRVHNQKVRVDELRREVTHYESKVHSIDHAVESKEAKGKSPNKKSLVKQDRNHEKLVLARANFADAERELCLYLEEVTDRGWKDMIPLVVKLVEWEKNTLKDDLAAVNSMQTMMDRLNRMAVDVDMQDFRNNALKTKLGSTLNQKTELSASTDEEESTSSSVEPHE